jgi:hypothetical protein
MGAQATRLKSLLQQRHWQTYRTFCAEYDRAAKTIDSVLVGSWPSRAQLHRWLSGDLKGLPYPDHCRILETMFPGYTAAQLFEPVDLMAHEVADSSTDEWMQVLETVANNLDAPDAAGNEWDATPRGRLSGSDASSLSPQAALQNAEGINDVARELGQKLLTLKKVLRLSTDEVRLIADASGHLIELELRLHIDIAPGGSAELSYYYELLNMTDKPITRIVRESWFEYTDGGLSIAPVNEGNDRRIAIQRLHETPTMVKMACQISPAIQPGERAILRYVVKGGQFRDHLYWRQTIRRYTRHLTISLRHQGVGLLTSCSAIEEHPDGAENSASEELLWDYDGNDVTITLTRDYLRPNQSITLRWEVDRESAR